MGRSVADFLNHRTKERGGGYLKNWRKREPPKLNAVLHRDVVPESVWRHQWYKVESREFQGKIETKVRWDHLVCLETEDLLQKRTKRADDGSRTSPPKRCGLCRLGEWLRAAIRDGLLPMEAKIFRFEAEDDEKPTVLHAAPFAGLVYDEMDEDAARHLAKFNISPRNAFKEDGSVKCNYLFAIVDNDDASAGVQVTIEAAALGAAVQDCMASVIAGEKCDEDLEGAAGDPFSRPYVFQWQYFPNESFSKKYKAVAMRKARLAPAVLELIKPASEGGSLPDIERFRAKHNPKLLRAQMERHWVGAVKPPWDEIFPKLAQAPAPEEAAEEAPPRQLASSSPAVAAKPRGPKGRGPAKEDLGVNPDGLDPESDDVYRCEMPFKNDVCGRLTAEEVDVCPRCGHDYTAAASPAKSEATPLAKAALSKTPPADQGAPVARAGRVVDKAEERAEEQDEDEVDF